jgi:hypothetical protein
VYMYVQLAYHESKLMDWPGASLHVYTRVHIRLSDHLLINVYIPMYVCIIMTYTPISACPCILPLAGVSYREVLRHKLCLHIHIFGLNIFDIHFHI